MICWSAKNACVAAVFGSLSCHSPKGDARRILPASRFRSTYRC